MEKLNVTKLAQDARKLAVEKNLSREIVSLIRNKDETRVIIKAWDDSRMESEYMYFDNSNSEATIAVLAKVLITFSFYNLDLPTYKEKEDVREEQGQEEQVPEDAPKSEKPTKVNKGNTKSNAVGSKEKQERKARAVPELKEEEKSVPYNREKEEHKILLAGHLKKEYGADWAKKEGVGEFAKSLQGLPFIDKSGRIVPSFNAKLVEFFA